MAPVFAHGRLRLYLLKLLDEAPRHGYEVIRLLEERFQGLYAPSAGTVYPRLAKLEAEGLVTHTTEGGRKVYSITDAGRAELAGRGGELADLELEIRESVSELAAEIRADVRGAAGDLRDDVRRATHEARNGGAATGESWQQAKEELKRAKQEWKEQARRAKDESRRAREDAQQARRQAKEAQERAREQVQRVTQQVRDHFGSWEGLADLTKETVRPTEPPAWAEDTPTTDNPARDLDRLLDRFRDDIRDAARDNGVTESQLREARRHLSTAAAHIGAILRTKG
ncbi:PadR family transcriptional regulator [Streptomyces sp. CBMA152]|uniref:PadR family transcriptional regulator n=1 Tax=Streptomyces sp. CBMA152 TaxID=1896312 RepID=UPI001660C766|nr:PadR family transcriptional regulator [Streptomyces sp. CBMA152]MBD0747593.1 PadR family transcriptional regulator [Streptomyces sp. CBMA152]